MEAIVSKALSDVVDEEGASRLSDDWITNFFDHARLISDPEMQELWSRILAGEANTPGSFSRHTINIMRDLDKADAQLFQRLCSFGWTIGKFRIILPYSIQHIADSMGLDGAALRHFEVLGLALYERDEFLCTNLSHSQTAIYFNQRVELNLTHGSIPVGPAVLTRAGEQLAQIVGPTAVQDVLMRP